MNIKDKGKSKRDKAKSKAIIGIVLATIMLASVFAGISASAIADNNTVNESVDDSAENETISEEESAPVEDAIVDKSVEEKGVVVSAARSITVSMHPDSPARNIANETGIYKEILRLRFQPTGEAANITTLVIKEEGTINGQHGITGMGVSNSTSYGTDTLAKGAFTADNGEVTLRPNAAAYLGQLKDLYVWVNVTGDPGTTGYFELGQSIILNLTSFTADGLASGDAMTPDGTPQLSHTIFGAGKLNQTKGLNDTAAKYEDAGENATGIVIMQLNFTSEIEGCVMNNVTLKDNGTVNASKDINTIYLVNDTDLDGEWNRTATGTAAEKIITNLGTFTADNGTVKLDIGAAYTTEKTMAVNQSRNYLVVVNTTKWFWSDEQIVINVTDFNATGDAGALMGRYVAGTAMESAAEVQSNATTGQARIIVDVGANQPYKSYIYEGINRNVENLQVNFTAIAGRANITYVMLTQNGSTYAPGNTTPKIYWDVDNDGNATSMDRLLGSIDDNFTTAINATLGGYNNYTTVFTDGLKGAKLVDASSEIWMHITGNIYNSTDYPKANLTVNITYLNDTDQSNTITNFTINNVTETNDTCTWTDISSLFIYPVKDITDITWDTSADVTRQNATEGAFDIIATVNYAVVPLATNLTIGVENETNSTTGQESKYVILAVNTTSDFAENYETQVVVNTSAAYGNWSNYIAWDTKHERQIYNSNNASISETKITATSNAHGLYMNLTASPTQPGANVGLGEEFVSVMSLNFSFHGPNLGVAGSDTTTINSIIISSNGSANESNNVTIGLVEDTDKDGLKDANEPLIASKNFTADNGTVKLDTAIDLTVTGTAKDTYKHILVVVNASSDIPINDTLWFNVTNPSLDYIARVGVYVGMNDYDETTIAGEQLYAVGAISAKRTYKISSGSISSEVDRTKLALMQVNFTASSIEDVNVTGITLTWNGTADDASIENITIVHDADSDGVFDTTETTLNATDWAAPFSNDWVWLNFTPAGNLTVTKGTTSSILVLVNTSAADLESAETIRINISSPYTDYNATGVTSKNNITDYNITTITSAKMTAAFTGTIRAYGYNLTKSMFVEGAQTKFPLLALNFTTENETINISSIKITASGSAYEKNNITGVCLVEDTTPLGTYNDEAIISDTQNFTVSNSNVTLTPSPEIQVAGGNFRRILVIADITAEPDAGENIILSLKNPSTDYVATGLYSGVRVEDSETTAIANTTYITGNVSVAVGINTTATGPITAQVQNRTVIMQLNFSAVANMEDINITGLNLTWEGDGNATDNITAGAYNDSNNDGIIDSTEIDLGNATFDVNNTANFTFWSNLTVTNGSYANMLVYLNITSGYNFSVGKQLKVGLIGYTAYGDSSQQKLTAYGVSFSSNVLMGTGNLTVEDGLADRPQYDIGTGAGMNLAGVNESIVVWQINLTAGTPENITINNITLTERGTAHGANDIARIYLVNDTDANGKWNMTEGDSGIISDKGTFGADNGTVLLTLSANNTITNGTWVNYLVVVNTTSTFYDGETLNFSINRSTTDGEPTRLQGINATGEVSGIIVYNNFTTCQFSNGTMGYGSVDLYKGASQPTTVTNASANFKSVLQLNFSAPRGAINITNITVKENGTAVNGTDFTLISVIDDADGDGVYDSDETKYNTTAALSVENGTVRIETYGLIVNGSTKKNVLIAINTTTPTAGKTLVFEVNRTLGVGYNATCNVSAQTPYSNETGEINNSITVQAKEVVTEIQLYEGWNLISMWLVPSNTSIEAVTSEIADNYDSIWAYDGCDKDWDSYKSGWPNDLTTMTAGWGYWIDVTTACNLSVTGTFLPSGANVTMPTYRVCEGWNLIGFHSENETVNASTYLSGVTWKEPMYTWDAQTKSYEYVRTTTPDMVKGEGYWLVVTETEATIYPY